MTRYAVLLRGINVGGARMTMVELRAALAPLPLGAVATVLATGNVVGTFDGDAEQLGVLVEQALSDAFGYDARVVVVAATRLAALLEACPYPPDAPGTHTYLTFARDPSVLDELAVAVAAQDPAETATRLGPEVVAWQAPVGGRGGPVRFRRR